MRAALMNGGAFCRTAFAAINKTATAGSTGDATEVNCEYVDRKQSDHGPFMSMKVIITYTTTLAAAATLTFAGNMQDATSAGGAGVADYGNAFTATTIATGPSGGGTVTGTVEIDVDLSAAREFVRAQLTPNLSAANTDTLEWSATYVLFGSPRQPVSSKIVDIVG